MCKYLTSQSQDMLKRTFFLMSVWQEPSSKTLNKMCSILNSNSLVAQLVKNLACNAGDPG